MFKSNEKKTGKPWPKDSIWPEPLYDGEGMQWEYDLVDEDTLDEGGQELMGIREYFDALVEEGRLNEDYSLNEDYDLYEDEESDDPDDDETEGFVPEKGEYYWDNGFLLDVWEEDLSAHMNLLKIDIAKTDPAVEICRIIGYDFINENLLRQAFTRRAFAIEYGLSGCNEELEFLGDSVLNTVVTREIVKHLADNNVINTEAPFDTKYNEGDFSKIRMSFVSKEYLAQRAAALGLDKYILYGTADDATESSREDMMEALIGAVTIDSDWNWAAIETVIDRMLRMQLGDPDRYLKKTYFEIFNSWHQRHFGRMPDYEVHQALRGQFDCTLRYFIPENDKDIWRDQRIDVTNESSRSIARERAAELAYRFVVRNGLWINLKDAELVPDMENSINQLQELFQKKYVDERATYEFEEQSIGGWECNCICDGLNGYGRASSKIKAKKKAAYMVLILLLESAGICEKEWRDRMYDDLMGK